MIKEHGSLTSHDGGGTYIHIATATRALLVATRCLSCALIVLIAGGLHLVTALRENDCIRKIWRSTTHYYHIDTLSMCPDTLLFPTH